MGVSALLIAANFGSTNAVRELLASGADYMAVDRNSANVLQYADGHTRTLGVLLEVLFPSYIQ